MRGVVVDDSDPQLSAGGGVIDPEGQKILKRRAGDNALDLVQQGGKRAVGVEVDVIDVGGQAPGLFNLERMHQATVTKGVDVPLERRLSRREHDS